MAKRIKIDEATIGELRKQFEEELKSVKLADGKFSFQRNFADVDAKAALTFDPIAYRKMLKLVDEFDNEVAWHGLARRDDTEENGYYISDILVYPQEVTGATVTTDQVKYQTWLYSHDDEVFNAIKMQGHSHVNMGVTPSATDNSLYESILSQLTDDMFYIFLIWNKRNEKTVMIYDMPKNLFFETKDVTIYVEDDGSGISAFIEDAKSKVQKEVKRPIQMQMGLGYGGHKGSSYSCFPSGSKKKKDKGKNSVTNAADDWYDDDFYAYGYGSRYGYGYGAY